MTVELRVPPLGESITEAVVGKWNKKPGDAVKVDEPIVILETDKVTIDVVAPSSGALQAISFQEGSKVKIGDVLGLVNEAATGQAAPAQAAPPATAVANSAAPVESKAEAKAELFATPVAKNVAAGLGLDATSIAGSGSQGRVTKDDVVRAFQVPTPASPAAAPAKTEPMGASERLEERVKMTPLRKRVAERLLQAQSSAAILTTFNEVDVSAVSALRKQYGEKFAAKHGVKLGFMSFFVRAAVEALRAFPSVNAEISGDEVILKHYYDIGVAVSGSRGLVVPVVRNAQNRSMADLEKTIAEFGVKAKTDKLTLSDLQGGTFTISNGGIFGSMLSTPILNPPQTGILGMHNIVERPVALGGQVVIRPIMYLALSYDHRLIDGREAVQFLVRIKECIESPERLLLDV